jgi:dihydropteroate synthase
MKENSQIININEKAVDISTPIIMAILNITPDSFYSGNRFMYEDEIIKTVDCAISEGATIIDIGAQSTRPFADIVSEEEEKARLSFALEIIRNRFENALISVDTFSASIAKYVTSNYGVGMINDVSGGNLDKDMFSTVSEAKVAYVLTHSRGNSQTMQHLTNYDNIISEMLSGLQVKVNTLKSLGVNDVIIDPGFGFAKTREQNFKILKNLHIFKELELPLLCGVSRKSMIFKTLNTSPEESLNGTTAAHILALQGGAKILRVHDVREAKEAIAIFNAYSEA